MYAELICVCAAYAVTRVYFNELSCTVNFSAATLRTLKSGRLIEVGRLTEVQYKLDRKGSKHDFVG